ncbi:cytochrome c peroxidase [Marivirga sericea]|uniref:Cytochrome c peroxidase n=1 Tax=Marivirga sericea TaxID=1028 RepID=A0A1X7KHA7_9BACT|nr:cytochrome c peroxidase [Marivirga sericea]SMG40571.1 cytochrome c peroxidase [Marivirga sericea]
MLKIHKNYIFSLLLILGFTIGGCNEKEIIPQYTIEVPDNLGGYLPQNGRNKFTEKGVLLGEKIFFDQRFSSNGKVSCATCHEPERAFTDGLALSNLGVSGKALNRNSPTLANVAWAVGLFWDGGALNLESLSFGPLTHVDEMNNDLDSLVDWLSNDPEYSPLFLEAFPALGVSSASISRALAQFQRTLISANSKYDQYTRTDENIFSAAEKRGLQLFTQHCSSCHETDHLTDFDYHNNGLDSEFNDTSLEEVFMGRYRISRDERDIGKYKTPTLRNIALTAPYMHDGRFPTLESVLIHYAKGVQDSETLSPILKDGEQLGIKLSPKEQSEIIEFLHTLTDEEFINNY